MSPSTAADNVSLPLHQVELPKLKAALRVDSGPSALAKWATHDFLVLGLPWCKGSSPRECVVGMSVDMQKAFHGFALIRISR